MSAISTIFTTLLAVDDQAVWRPEPAGPDSQGTLVKFVPMLGVRELRAVSSGGGSALARPHILPSVDLESADSVHFHELCGRREKKRVLFLLFRVSQTTTTTTGCCSCCSSSQGGREFQPSCHAVLMCSSPNVVYHPSHESSSLLLQWPEILRAIRTDSPLTVINPPPNVSPD